MFTSEVGTPIDPSHARRDFENTRAHAGVPALSPYEIRHPVASPLVDADVLLCQVAGLLGDKDLEMVVRRYRHRTDGAVTSHVSVLGSLTSHQPGRALLRLSEALGEQVVGFACGPAGGGCTAADEAEWSLPWELVGEFGEQRLDGGAEARSFSVEPLGQLLDRDRHRDPGYVVWLSGRVVRCGRRNDRRRVRHRRLDAMGRFVHAATRSTIGSSLTTCVRCSIGSRNPCVHRS